MQCVGGHRPFRVRIEDGNVGVGTDGEPPFARRQSEDARRLVREDTGEVVERETTLGDALAVDEGEQGFHAREAVREILERRC
jgi:hypothetical protein